MRRRNILFLIFVVLLAVGTYYIDFGFGKPPSINIAGYQNSLTLQEGLDLKGGIQITMQAVCPNSQPTCDRAGKMSALIDNVNRRIAQGLAVNDAVVRQEDGYRILIQLPGLKDDQQALQLLGQTGQMNIIDTGAQPLALNTDVTGKTCTTTCQAGQYRIVFTGAQLDPNSISAAVDPTSGQPIVTFAFTGSAKRRLPTIRKRI